jgi:hypothetical protein
VLQLPRMENEIGGCVRRQDKQRDEFPSKILEAERRRVHSVGESPTHLKLTGSQACHRGSGGHAAQTAQNGLSVCFGKPSHVHGVILQPNGNNHRESI